MELINKKQIIGSIQNTCVALGVVASTGSLEHEDTFLAIFGIAFIILGFGWTWHSNRTKESV